MAMLAGATDAARKPAPVMDSRPYAAVERALAGTRFARVVYVERTGSTNDDAAALLDDDGALGTTIVAEEQTRGAGRKGRTWLARPGSALLFTTILPRELLAEDLWSVPFWTALVVRDALANCGVQSEMHWPNDLLLDGKKLAGILCTSRIIGKRARVGCGIGINVHRGRDADARIAPLPAFCDDATHVERAALLSHILNLFEMRLALLDVPEQVARRWEREAGLPGRRYRLLRDGEARAFDATAIALESGGGLIVERDDGSRETIGLADARALR
jgi:BirA family biotin operon repressor/biotin-[acetyl-CoA-carboxylase] ligase